MTRTIQSAAAVVTVLLIACAARGQAHAPWPADWNNWADPALWVTVGNPGNPGEPSGAAAGGFGPDAVVGGVPYTYRIGVFKVTAGQYAAFLNAVAKVDTYGLYNTDMDTLWDPNGCNIKRVLNPDLTYCYSVDPAWADRPVNLVDWGDAARFANWLANGQPIGPQGATTTEDGSYCLNGAVGAALAGITRKPTARFVIPSEDEWYKAAYHKNDGVTGNYWDYPAGTNARPSNALTDPDGGNNANYEHLGVQTIGAPYYRTVAGEFENSESPYGTFDQGGCLEEWTQTIYHHAVLGDLRILRGSSYIAAYYALNAAGRPYDLPYIEGYAYGFRIAEVPEPATLALLALGALALVRRRRSM